MIGGRETNSSIWKTFSPKNQECKMGEEGTGNYYLADAWAITLLCRYVTSIISVFVSVFHGCATTGLSVIQMQVMSTDGCRIVCKYDEI